MRSAEHSHPQKGEWFATTQWTRVVQAGQADSAEARDALNELCQIYWPPVLAYTRLGHDVHQAEDLTQGFFAWLLAKNHLQSADRDKGKFRSFLLTYLKGFLANERARSQRQKRGGGRAIVSLDSEKSRGLHLELSHHQTPDQVFEKQWAHTLLDQTMHRLRSECHQAGKGPLFDLVEGMISGDRDDFSYARVADRLNMNEGAIRAAVSRLRKRHKQLLREEIARTLVDSKEVDQEIRHLADVLRLG